MMTMQMTTSMPTRVMPTRATPTSVSPIDTRHVVVRPLADTDSMDELTMLLHRAYKGQIDMGLHPLAGRQSSEITARRAASGECFVAELDGRLIGTILLQEVEDAKFPDHFLRGDVAHFSLLGVDPEAQGLGVGRRLLESTERRAAELGYRELACSMAEPDEGLMRFYERLGYRLVTYWQWPYTNYRSAILSKGIEDQTSEIKSAS